MRERYSRLLSSEPRQRVIKRRLKLSWPVLLGSVPLGDQRNFRNGLRIHGMGNGVGNGMGKRRVPMFGYRSYRGHRGRSRAAGRDVYEVSYFARKHGISRAQAERIIRRAHGSRQRANALCTLIKKQFLAA